MLTLSRRPRSLAEAWLSQAARPAFLWEDLEAPAPEREADLYETDDSVVVEVSVAGLKPEEVSIQAIGDTLSVSAEHKEEAKEEKRRYYQREIRVGGFVHSFRLPASVEADKAQATFEHGILRIALPKAEAAKPRQIKIQAA